MTSLGKYTICDVLQDHPTDMIPDTKSVGMEVFRNEKTALSHPKSKYVSKLLEVELQHANEHISQASLWRLGELQAARIHAATTGARVAMTSSAMLHPFPPYLSDIFGTAREVSS